MQTRNNNPLDKIKIGVVIPCFKVSEQIVNVIKSIPNYVDRIYVVDDFCPENTWRAVQKNISDPRVVLIRHTDNLGVGGALKTGYKLAILDEMDVVVKIDGDGQMPVDQMPKLLFPIMNNFADYSKGNRFYDLQNLREMPPIRIFGNIVLSFLTKFSSGYHDIFDPNNGYTAITLEALTRLNLENVDDRFFFESGMLFELNCIGAVVKDVPIPARYSNEVSNLKIYKVFLPFLLKHTKNSFKRIFYNYFLRDFSIASIELFLGILSLSLGFFIGLDSWIHSSATSIVTPIGTQFLVTLMMLFGVQFLINFLNYDINSVPKDPISNILS